LYLLWLPVNQYFYFQYFFWLKSLINHFMLPLPLNNLESAHNPQPKGATMGLGKLNIVLADTKCIPLKTCWMADLTIQTCSGEPLVNLQQDLLPQLQKRYGKPSEAICTSSFPMTTDQGGKTIDFTVGGVTETHTFTGVVQELDDVFAQLNSAFTIVRFEFINGFLTAISKDHGPQFAIAIGGTSDLTWGPIKSGSGIKITTRDYRGSKRINFYPGTDSNGISIKINHIEMDVLPGCYVVWVRCCYGMNEESSKIALMVQCGDHKCFKLLLPEIKNCSRDIIHPFAERVAMNELDGIQADEDKVVVIRALAKGAGLAKADLEAELVIRDADAELAGDQAQRDRIQAVQALVAMMPTC
jgi:hypothetical protein